MTNGADINKSVAFKNWILEGMNGDFEKYYSKNKTEVTVLQDQKVLRNILSTLKLKVENINLSTELDALNAETQELVKLYIKERLLPDLTIMQNESYNAFEEGTWYTIFGLLGLTVDDKFNK